ncbi:MAG: hypothetical protein ABIG64_05780 [Candidatus Omnitrophota bacterium]
MYIKIIDYLSKKKIAAEVIFLLILIIGFFLIMPPSLNYTDHAQWGLVFQKNLIDYIQDKGDFKGDFYEYMKFRYQQFHAEKISLPDAYTYHGIDPNGEPGWILNPTHYAVFVLSRMSQLAIYFLSFKLLGLEASLMVFGFLIFIFTYIYAAKVGAVLVNKRFGLILAVIASSNVYFNQLDRSMLFPFITIFPLLFFMSSYYLFLCHRRESQRNLFALLGLSISLALCFVNGYPNTNILMFQILFGFFTILSVNIIKFKNPDYTFMNWYKYILALIISLVLVLFITGIWGKLLGKDFFYGVNIILHDRVWGILVKRGSWASLTMTNDFAFSKIPEIAIRTFRVLFISSDINLSPHEPSFLQDISFFNIVEAGMFVAGLAYLIKREKEKQIIKHILLLLGSFFIYRIVTNTANAQIVGRYTYDFYFVLIFFAAYGLYSFVKFSRLNSRYPQSRVLYFLLSVIIFLNIFIFNARFVWTFGEGLNKAYGNFQLRKFYYDEVAKDGNFLIYDYYLQPHGYLYNLDVVSLWAAKVEYDLYVKLFVHKSDLKSYEAFKAYILDKGYKNVYFIFPTGPFRRGDEISEAASYTPPAFFERFSPFLFQYRPYKVIKNRKGEPTFWIYKFDMKCDDLYKIKITN